MNSHFYSLFENYRVIEEKKSYLVLKVVPLITCCIVDWFIRLIQWITGEKQFLLYNLGVDNVGSVSLFHSCTVLYFCPVYSTVLKPCHIFVMFTGLIFRKAVAYITDFLMQTYLLLLLFSCEETVRDNGTMLVIVKCTFYLLSLADCEDV